MIYRCKYILIVLWCLYRLLRFKVFRDSVLEMSFMNFNIKKRESK